MTSAKPIVAPRSGAGGEGHPQRLFLRGFLGLAPLWAGAIPAGVAFGVAARAAGLSPLESQLMSLVVFSAAGQLGAVSLMQDGASAALLVGTVVVMNAQLLLLGLTVGRQAGLGWPGRLGTAWLLTDGAYGVTVALGPLRVATLLGAGASMYVAWNVGTVLGAGLGAAIPNPGAVGLDLVAPLCFLAVLVPLVQSRPAVLVALVAGVGALALGRVAPGGVAVLGAGLAGCLVGAWVTRGAPPSPPGPAGVGIGARPEVTGAGVASGAPAS